MAKGNRGGKRAGGSSENTYTIEDIKAMRKREQTEPFGVWDQSVFDRLPKKLQDDRIIQIDKLKTSDGTRYAATIQWEDGYKRGVSEYGFGDFKYYLEQVLKKNREIEF